MVCTKGWSGYGLATRVLIELNCGSIYEGCLDAHSSWNNFASDEDLDFIPVGISKYQLGPDEEDHTFFSTNKVHYQMKIYLLDRIRRIFNIPKLIRFTTSSLGYELAYDGTPPSQYPLNYYQILLSCWVLKKENGYELTMEEFTYSYFL